MTQGWTVEELSSSQKHYQDILLTVAEQLSNQLHQLIRPYMQKKYLKNCVESDVERIVPLLYAFSWFIIHAAAALKPIGRNSQEQLILSGRNIICTIEDVMSTIFLLNAVDCEQSLLLQADLRKFSNRVVQGFLW